MEDWTDFVNSIGQNATNIIGAARSPHGAVPGQQVQIPVQQAGFGGNSLIGIAIVGLLFLAIVHG